VLEVEAAVFDPHPPTDVGEVLNYVTAMNYGLKRLKELPLSIRLIKEIHYQLLHDVRGQEKNPGEIRTTQNWIGYGGCSLAEASFVPPPPHEVMNALGALETFMHQAIHLPILVKIGIIHAQFETIHPFLDGNGRVGRLLITFLLCENEVLLRPVLYISHYFKRHRAEYYELLQKVRDQGDWESWVKFFLKGIAAVSLEATETARAIVGLREYHRSVITVKLGRAAGNGLKILEQLFERPIMTVSQIQTALNVTYQSANTLVQRFVEIGVLQEITGQERYRVFSYRPFIDLFAENKPDLVNASQAPAA
jgi:Fic family protein